MPIAALHYTVVADISLSCSVLFTVSNTFNILWSYSILEFSTFCLKHNEMQLKRHNQAKIIIFIFDT